jgi:hypothetical protein
MRIAAAFFFVLLLQSKKAAQSRWAARVLYLPTQYSHVLPLRPQTSHTCTCLYTMGHIRALPLVGTCVGQQEGACPAVCAQPACRPASALLLPCST